MSFNRERSTISMIALIALCSPAFIFSQWSRQVVTTYLGWVQETQVAEGRNDGIRRLYIASPGTRAIYECSWNGAAWDRVKIDSSSYQIRDIYVADGRNDNIVRVYATDDGNSLIEHTWTGTAWVHDTVGQSHALGVIVGACRNDGVMRVYASKPPGAAQNCIYEYTWQGGWIVDSMQGGDSWFFEPTLGAGRNDDTLRVYGSSFDDHVYEFSWNGSWLVTDVADSIYATDLAVGPGRNDGINRLYCANTYGHLLEFTWSGSDWSRTSDLQPTSATYMREVHVGNGRNDGVNRVYCTDQNGGLVEYTWTGSDWQADVMGSEFDGLTIGIGRNDGVMRVYAAAASEVAEYSYVTAVSEYQNQGADSQLLQVKPNPFRNKVVFHYEANDESQYAADIDLKIYDATGRMVRDFTQNLVSSIQHHESSIVWDGTDNYDQRLPAGVYFLKFVAGSVLETQKLLIVR